MRRMLLPNHISEKAVLLLFDMKVSCSVWNAIASYVSNLSLRYYSQNHNMEGDIHEGVLDSTSLNTCSQIGFG